MSGAEAISGLADVLAGPEGTPPGSDDVDRDLLFARQFAGHRGNPPSRSWRRGSRSFEQRRGLRSWRSRRSKASRECIKEASADNFAEDKFRKVSEWSLG